MTIAVGVACPEGLVVAADSRSSVLGPAGFRVATDYAHKVFDVGGQFAVATFGWATLEGKTISGVVREFVAQNPVPADVAQAAQVFRDHFRARIQAHIAAEFDPAPPAGVDPLGFIMAGYDANGIGRLQRIFPLTGQIVDVFQTNSPGGIWNGETDVMTRLLKGYDAARLDITTWGQTQKTELAGVEYLTPFGWMALQDGVDFATFVVRTTVDAQRFTNGTVGDPAAFPTCGGPVEVATVTWGDGVQWVQRTDLRT